MDNKGRATEKTETKTEAGQHLAQALERLKLSVHKKKDQRADKATKMKRLEKNKAIDGKALKEAMETRLFHRYCLITLLFWFLGSLVLALVLRGYVQPPDFMLSLYSGYMPHIKEYRLFCLSMTMAVFWGALCWLVFFYITYKKGILFDTELKPETRHALSSWCLIKCIFFFGVIDLIFLEMALATAGVGGAGTKDPRAPIIGLLDWVGGVLINIISLTFLLDGRGFL